MQPWAIGTLVAICVIFAIVLLIYVAIILIAMRRNSQHTENCINETTVQCTRYPAQDNILYYVDFYKQVSSLDVVAAGVYSGASLQSALAQKCGVHNPSELQLMYAGDSDMLAEVDMDQLMTPFNLGVRMRHTAMYPLVLVRSRDLQEPVEGVDGNNRNSAYLRSSAPSTQSFSAKDAASAHSRTTKIDINTSVTRRSNNNNNNNKNNNAARRPQEKQQLTHEDFYSANSGNDTNDSFSDDYDGQQDRRVASRNAKGQQGWRSQSDRDLDAIGFDSRGSERTGRSTPSSRRDAIPEPLIFPLTSLITSDTFVCICAGAYFYTDDGTQVDRETAAAVEEAMVTMEDGDPLKLPKKGGGGTAVVWPSKSKVKIVRWNSGISSNTSRVALRRSADMVRYTTDATQGSLQWTPFREPFTLPPGRWCVRAEAASKDRMDVKTASRVFTVEPSYVGSE